MAYSGLADFIRALSEQGELHRIKAFADPVLEITEITDRITKYKGKALLFEDTGTPFPLLINAYGSQKRISMALGGEPASAASGISELLKELSSAGTSLAGKLTALPKLAKLAGLLPVKTATRGSCQQVVINDPDLSILPVLKCWPSDGGRYITLPVVHTVHPHTGNVNAGMYRMQILDIKTTAMHWQRHKTGASHFEAWKETGRRMPVTVTLGGDPVYAWAATAPLPENIDEYILAAWLRKKRVNMVRCLTNELYIPSDADIVIEGYVEPSEEPVWEGPFGDHTGFYSLADWYPRFHVTCITHRRDAVYPATIVGIPPQEDAWIAEATEKIFIEPVKLAIQPEVEDFHMPPAGVAHNLLIVKIRKSYPGQGMKVISSLSGAGQMMFTKYIIVVSGDTDIRDYDRLARHVFMHFDPRHDLMFFKGPLDVLDHSSAAMSFGGKAGIDATVKYPEELMGRDSLTDSSIPGTIVMPPSVLTSANLFADYNSDLPEAGLPLLIVSAGSEPAMTDVEAVRIALAREDWINSFRLVLLVDKMVDVKNLHMVAWQVLGNSDPLRDHCFPVQQLLLIDGTTKARRKGPFPDRWPNVVTMDAETINKVDRKWTSYGFSEF
ncbi:MAG: menaquinone biosynthesis decarboxylase, partial [Bacteroidales bacterium]|nr:menaquinone biosynthesis decarboxylase [Bacteroidales bacterium]